MLRGERVGVSQQLADEVYVFVIVETTIVEVGLSIKVELRTAN